MPNGNEEVQEIKFRPNWQPPWDSETASAAIRKRWADPEQRKAWKQNPGLDEANAVLRENHEARFVLYANGLRLPPLPGCTAEQARWFWRQARFEATLTMKKLIKAGVVTQEDENAEEALHYCLTVMKAPVDQKTGLTAARTVLDFCKAKPAIKQDLTINKAEEWLAAVSADNEQVSDKDAGDQEEVA